MTDSVTCIEQRQQETEKTRKLITIGVIGSIALHGIMFTALNSMEKPLTEEIKPIEFIVVQEPEIKPEKKPKAKKTESPKTPKKPKAKKQKPQPTVKKKEIKTPTPPVAKTTPTSPPQKPPVAKTTPTPPPQKTPEVVKNIPQPQKTPEVVKNIPQPQATSPSPIPSLPPSPQPNITPSPQPSITQPQEVLTSNTLARNNAPRAVKPIENSSNNPLSNSFNSNARVENNNSNQTATVAPVSEDMPVSSGRLSRGNSNTPSAVNSQEEEINNLRNSLSRNNSQNSNNNSQNTVSAIPSNVSATSQSIPQRPQAKLTPPPPESIKCISNCNPSYPSELQGVEGKATVKVNLDNSGNVLGVSVVNPHSNGEVNRQALLAAKKMRFSSPSVNNATVQVSINFTVAGSEFDRIARQKKEEAQRQARLSQEKERQETQAQLERERLQRQQQLEKERQEREAQARVERQKREAELKKQQELEVKPTEILPSEIPNNSIESVDN